MSACVCKVREVLSPISQEFRGFRFLVALPNNAARTLSGASTTSFEAPYYVTHFGDFTSMDDLCANIERITSELRALGFRSIMMAGK